MTVPGAPREAIHALETFLGASLRRDEAAMRACVTRQTLESGRMRNDAPEGFTFSLGEAKMEGESVIIPMALTPPGATEPATQMECVMTLEDGDWKVDLGAALDRMMGGPMAEAMESMAAGMAQVMEGVGQAMAEALGGAMTGEIGIADRDWSGASLEVQEDEFLPVPAMTPLPKTTEAVREAVGADVPVTAAIGDLLQTLGSDETDVLVAWFEDTLFAGLGGILKAVVAEMPLQGRLHAIRIEAAGWVEDRVVALDGSDLVYRMFPANQEGYYSDDELRMILMSVLAGLPVHVDERSAGRRTLANDTDTELVPTMEAYKERHVPRFMRRISELLGRNISLERGLGRHEPDGVHGRPCRPLDGAVGLEPDFRRGGAGVPGAGARGAPAQRAKNHQVGFRDAVRTLRGWHAGRRLSLGERGERVLLRVRDRRRHDGAAGGRAAQRGLRRIGRQFRFRC